MAGLLHKALPKKKPYIYVSLISAMVIGRIVWGVARIVMFGFDFSKFGWAAFWSGAVINAIPGIIVQIILIPLIVLAIEKTKYKKVTP